MHKYIYMYIIIYMCIYRKDLYTWQTHQWAVLILKAFAASHGIVFTDEHAKTLAQITLSIKKLNIIFPACRPRWLAVFPPSVEEYWNIQRSRMKYKYANSINFLNHYHSISLKTHLSRGEFFPNGINRNICKCRASASSHRKAAWEPSEDRTLTCPQKSPVTKARCSLQWPRAWTQPKPASCSGLLSARTYLPEVKIEKHCGICCLEFRSSLLHALSSFGSHQQSFCLFLQAAIRLHG